LLTAAGGEIDFTVGASGASTANSDGMNFHVTSNATNTNTINVGYIAYAFKVGDIISYGGTFGGIVTSVSTSGCTSGQGSTLYPGTCAGTLQLSANVTYSTGNNLLKTVPGPSVSYPGNILRLYKDSGTGNIAYRYDTVYFKTPSADCSGTSGNSYLTCATEDIGYWHQNLQIAVPGAGSSACPDGSGSTCFVGTISTVSFTGAGVETINFTSGTLASTVANVRPTVYRTSIPYTVTSRAAETITEPSSSCSMTAGSNITLVPMIEYRGSRLELSYCDQSGPGPSFLLNQYAERFDGPFQFVIDSPNHMGNGAIALSIGSGWIPAFAQAVGTGGAGGFGNAMAEDWNYPAQTPRIRLVPDVYAYCPGPYSAMLASPYGGQCASHQGEMGAHMIDDAILSQLRLR
jgi:hypothetical protein